MIGQELSSISNDEELKRTIARISELMNSKPRAGTSQADELASLAAIVERYEDIHYPVDPPALDEAIRFRIEQMKL